MNRNVKIAKELVKLAKRMMVAEEEPYYFVVKCVEKRVEIYDYEKGETGEDSKSFSMDIVEKDDNLKECLKKAFGKIGMEFDINDISIQDGFVDSNRLENGNGDEASDKEIELWKQGRKRLWIADYTWSISIQTNKEPDADFIRNELKKE